MGLAARRVRLLGKFEVEGVETSALGSRKGRTLLKRLALDAGSPVSVDALVEILWREDDQPAKPAEQVSVLVSRLRRALGQDAITFSDGNYTLAAEWVDVDELRSRIDEAARRLGDGSAAQSRAAASAALALVRGPLLAEDLDEPWTQEARASVERLVTRARHVAAEGAMAGGLGVEAAEHASAALAADPYDEAALRLLMRAHVAAGRPALALAAYAETSALVSDELGADLDAQTQALHVEVLRGDGPTAQDLTLAVDRVVLAGRDAELAQLGAALRRAQQGTAVVVDVEGEAGIGKTRLLAAFAEQASKSAQILRSTADRSGVLPLEPILDALARRLNTSSDEERIAILGPELDLLDPLLRPGAAGDVMAYRHLLVAYEPGAQSAPAVLHVALLGVFARLCAQRPVVLLLDDAQLADAATVSWLGLVARHSTGLALLAVAARRPGGPAMPATETISLGRLDAAVAAAIVAPFVDEDRIEAVVARSAGLPLFLVELAHATGDTLPDSIRESVVARIADAGAAAATMHAAAVLGGDIDVDLLAAVLEHPTPELLDHLEEGARRRILDDASSGYVFRHDLIREALEADTPSARRAWLHRQAAQLLVHRVPAEHLNVAHHARLGGDPALAAGALCAAAEQAGARFDHDAALALAEDSIGLAESADAHLIRGRSFVLLRRYAEARQEAERARALGAGAPAIEIAAFAAYYARDLDAVLRFADEAASISEDLSAFDTCQYLAAKVLHSRGDLADAEQRLLPIVGDPGRSRIAPFVRTWMTLIHLHRGHVDIAARAFAGSDQARLAPIPYASLYIDQFGAHLAAMQGRPLDALATAERLARATAEQNAMRFLGRAEVYRGWALSLVCDPSAPDAMEAARQVSRDSDNPEPLGQTSLDLVAFHLDRNRPADALRLLDEVDEVLAGGAQVSNGWRIAMRAHYLRGRFAVTSGDMSGALEAADSVIAAAAHHGVERYDVLGSLLRMEVTAAAGGPVDVKAVDVLLPRLLSVARPEAWRIAARLGGLLDSQHLLDWSSDRVDELIVHAAPHAEQIQAEAARLLNTDR